MRSTSEALAQLRAANPVPATYATMSEARGSTSHGRGRTRAGLLVAATAGVAASAPAIRRREARLNSARRNMMEETPGSLSRSDDKG